MGLSHKSGLSRVTAGEEEHRGSQENGGLLTPWCFSSYLGVSFFEGYLSRSVAPVFLIIIFLGGWLPHKK